MAAFTAGAEAGYALEMDVRVLADGSVVVFHDDTLMRMTGLDVTLASQSATALRKVRLSRTSEPVPHLSEVLAEIAGRVPLLVELKNFTDSRKLEAAVWRQLQNYDGDFAIQSFNPGSVAWFNENAPEACRGQLATRVVVDEIESFDPVQLGRLSYLDVAKPHFIGYDARWLATAPTTEIRQRGLPLLAWTVRSAANAATALGIADNIIFEGFRPPLPHEA